MRNPALTDVDLGTIRAYEDAATAIGRLDAAARHSAPGLRELLVIRCAGTPTHEQHDGMIALVRGDGEGGAALERHAAGVREGAASARGGALPSVATLHALLRQPPPEWPTREIDEILLDTRERTPPVLKAAVVSVALQRLTAHPTAARAEPVMRDAARQADPNGEGAATAAARLVSLAVTLVLCVGGAITDAWLTLPPGPAAADSLQAVFSALARDARAAERGLAAAQALCRADEERVRESLGRAAYSALDLLALLRDDLVTSVTAASRTLGLTPPTVSAALARLIELGIASEVTGRARSRAFVYDGLVRALHAAPPPL